MNFDIEIESTSIIFTNLSKIKSVIIVNYARGDYEYIKNLINDLLLHDGLTRSLNTIVNYEVFSNCNYYESCLFDYNLFNNEMYFNIVNSIFNLLHYQITNEKLLMVAYDGVKNLRSITIDLSKDKINKVTLENILKIISTHEIVKK